MSGHFKKDESTEKRQHPRVDFLGKARMAMKSHVIDVKIGNISFGGLHFFCNEMLGLGDHVSIQIEGLSHGKPFDEKVIGRVVIAHRGGGESSYGLQFGLFLDEDRQPALVDFVTSSIKKKVVSFLRNTVPDPEG